MSSVQEFHICHLLKQLLLKLIVFSYDSVKNFTLVHIPVKLIIKMYKKWLTTIKLHR